ncbi:MAG: hypothetical protein AAGI11_22425 [Pseudomonadota bacterium]
MRISCSELLKFGLGLAVLLLVAWVLMHCFGLDAHVVAVLLFLGLIIGAVVRFLYLLQTTLGDDYDVVNVECRRLFQEKDVKLISKLIFYGYLATFFTLLIAIMPPVLLSKSSEAMEYVQGSSVGILVACRADAVEFSTSCERNPEGEWVVNIGGQVVKPEHTSWQEATKSLLATAECAAKAEGEVPKECRAAISDAREKISKLDQQGDTAGEDIPAVGVAQIHGGAVVPLYMIVISLLGAAVGLARRLPEYQRQGSRLFFDAYITRVKQGEVQADDLMPMDAAEVREAVVFQVMQVFSAPLVAITAYSLVGPANTDSVVLIAFASGFSTEAVLVLIRKGVDKLGKGEPKTGSVRTIEEALSAPDSSGESGLTKDKTSLPKRRKKVAEAAKAAARTVADNESTA